MLPTRSPGSVPRSMTTGRANGSRTSSRLLDNGFDLGGEQLKTRPRGVPDDHPRLGLLRPKSLTAGRVHGTPPWLSTEKAVDHSEVAGEGRLR